MKTFKEKSKPEIKSGSKINWVMGFMRLGCMLSVWGSGFVFGYFAKGGSSSELIIGLISRGGV